MTGNRAHVMLDKCNSGGSTASLGSSPGASFSSSLTVPDYCPAGPSQMAGPVCPIAVAAGQCPNAGGSKLPRSTSPFNIKARVKRRREKRLEKQANLNIGLDDCQNPVYPGPELSPPAATSFTTSATTGPSYQAISISLFLSFKVIMFHYKYILPFAFRQNCCLSCTLFLRKRVHKCDRL